MAFAIPPSTPSNHDFHSSLAVIFNTPGFSLPGSTLSYVVDTIVIVSITIKNLDNCLKKFPIILTSLPNNTHFRINFGFDVTSCTLNPGIVSVKLAFILYNTV